MTRGQIITPCLWFDGEAEEAAQFYVSIFRNGRIRDVIRNPMPDPVSKGSAILVRFELDGQSFTALNGGPQFRFTEAVSMVVNCTTQEEVDHYWQKLAADGGTAGHCGWLKDKFGVSWQVVPTVLADLLQDEDPPRSERVMKAMMQMTRLDIAQLQAAQDSG